MVMLPSLYERSLLPALVMALPLVAGCASEAEPRAQLVVYLDTDVAVPDFADRIRIELLDVALPIGTGPMPPGFPVTYVPPFKEVVVGTQADLPVSFGFRQADDGSSDKM